MTGPTAVSDTPRRDFARLRLGAPALLQTLDARLKVEIVDLSQGGAHLILPDKSCFVKDCLLVWLSFEAFGAVTWRDGVHMGMRFDEPISQKAILETRRKAPSIASERADEVSFAAREWASGNLRR